MMRAVSTKVGNILLFLWSLQEADVESLLVRNSFRFNLQSYHLIQTHLLISAKIYIRNTTKDLVFEEQSFYNKHHRQATFIFIK